MKTKEVSYVRKFSLGNYETETLGVTIELDEGEKFVDAIAAARKAVMSQASVASKPQTKPVQELNSLLVKTQG